MVMPGYRKGFSRRRSSGPRAIVNSIKNSTFFAGGVSSTTTTEDLAKAVTSPSPTSKTDVSHGCVIKAVYLIVDGCGLGGTGVLNNMVFYLWKNPGDNLASPSAFAVGSSNEKKFVFREWAFMVMRNQDGNNPFHWEGWIPIPKRYQRMGTDDTLSVIYECTGGVTGHIMIKSIYKWYR